MSTKNAGLAKKLGYTNVRVFLQGQPAWNKAGLPTCASKGFVEKGNIILVDLRSEKKSKLGRIPRSVTIPYATLDDRIDDFPTKAPIVLYSDNREEAMEALADLREEGFKKVSLVPGMFQGWIKNGGKLTKDPIVTEINWKRKLGKGEVSLADFKKAAAGKDPNVVILDVRTKDEAAAGKLKNSIAIPLDEIGARMGELPKDKMIYVHCTTGARADMAAQELKKNGFKAKFLVANVECEGNKCEFED